MVALHEGSTHIVMELLVSGSNREAGAQLNFQACDILLFDGDQPSGKRSYRKVVSPKLSCEKSSLNGFVWVAVYKGSRGGDKLQAHGNS
jgi:hypothetical protein